MKKFLAVILSIVLVFAFASCGSRLEDQVTPDTPEETGEAEETQDEPQEEPENEGTEDQEQQSTGTQSFELVVGGVNSEAAQKALLRFEDLVEEYSNGSIILKSLTDENLIGDDVKLDMTMKGECDIAIGTASGFAPLIKDLYLYDTFYLFMDDEEFREIGAKGVTVKDIQASAEEKGVKMLSVWGNGFHNLTTTWKRVDTPSDIEGMKLAVTDGIRYKILWEDLGAEVRHLDPAEIYRALDKTIISGQENTLENSLAASFQDVCTFLNMTEHYYSPFIVIMNQDSFNAMNEQQQKAITDAAREAQQYSFEQSEAYEAYAEKEFEKAGVTLVKFSDKEKEAFAKAAEGTRNEKKIRSLMDNPELLDDMKAELRIFRKSKESDDQ